jgi:putative proteasome-type protease
MDSTLRSNISVGMPLDLLVYEADALRVTRFVTIASGNPYYGMISATWGKRLRQVFAEMPNPTWHAGSDASHALHGGAPQRAAVPADIATAQVSTDSPALQRVAASPPDRE